MLCILRIVCNMRLGVVGVYVLAGSVFDFSDAAFFLVDIVL